MKALALSLALLFGSAVFAGTAQYDASKLVPVKSKVVTQVHDVASSDQYAKALTVEVTSRRALEVLSSDLQSANADLTAKNTVLAKQLADAVTLLTVLSKEIAHTKLTDSDNAALAKVSPGDAFNAALSVENGQNELEQVIKKLSDDNSAMVDKYNSLLNEANLQISMARLETAQQQRTANALAIYSLMPKYTPPTQVNIRYMNCDKLPALCVQ